MRLIVFVGMFLVGALPVVLLFTLFIYKICNDFKKKRFERNNNLVLSRSRIGEILDNSTTSESIRVFNSAICDHAEVEGIKYYTKFPFGLSIVLAHDHHRKAFIAHEVGIMLKEYRALDGDLDFCSDLLLCLIKDADEKYYTHLFAWDSLSSLAIFQKRALLERIGKDFFCECISKDIITGIGVIRFIFNLKEGCKDLDNVSNKMINDMILYTILGKNMPLIALLVFKLEKSHGFSKYKKKTFMKKINHDSKFDKFLKCIKELSNGFTKEELSAGLKNFGLQSPPYSHDTTEGEIVGFLVEDFIPDLYIPASYMLHSFDSVDLRQYKTDFLWC